MTGPELRVETSELAGIRRELTSTAEAVEQVLAATRGLASAAADVLTATPDARALLAAALDGLVLLGADLVRDGGSMDQVAEAYRRTEGEAIAALRALTAVLAAREAGMPDLRPQAVDEDRGPAARGHSGSAVLDALGGAASSGRPSAAVGRRRQRTHRAGGPHAAHLAHALHAVHLTHLAHLAHRAHAERLAYRGGRWGGSCGGAGAPGGAATGLAHWHAPGSGLHGAHQPRPCATARPSADTPPPFGRWPLGICQRADGTAWLTPGRPERPAGSVRPGKTGRPTGPARHPGGRPGHPGRRPGHSAGVHPAGEERSSARRTILRRAAGWAAHPVPYSMAAGHHGWRADCSGFISMAWGLDHSYTTVTLPRVSHRISKGELRPGDALLNRSPGRHGHVVLFDRWADPEHTAYYGYEQSPGGTKHRRIPYPYFPGHGRFVPYRLNRLGR